MKQGEFELVTLRQGARAVRHAQSGEVMHPSVGPWVEARSLYVNQSALEQRLQSPGEPLCIYDFGMGAAANLAAALACARELGDRRQRDLRIISFERDLDALRLALNDLEGFAFLKDFERPLSELLDAHAWDEPGISIRLLYGDALKRLSDAPWSADIVFFDPFSHKYNLELWTPRAFELLRERCRQSAPGAMLFTYSAATPTRVSLLLAGFFVGVGDAIGTKRETTAASTHKEALVRPLGGSWIEHWRRSSARLPHGDSESTESQVEARLLAHPQFRWQSATLGP